MQIEFIEPTAPATPIGHAHAADLEACVDLINSTEFPQDDGVPEEHLPTVDDAIAFFTSRGLAHEATIRAQAEAGRGGEAAWLARLYATRDGAAQRLGCPRRGARAVRRCARHGERAAAPRSARRARPWPRRRGGGPPPLGRRSHGRGARPDHRAAGRGDRDRRDRSLPDLRQRRLPMGVRGHVTRRPPALVRHVVVRQPREGASLPLEAADDGRRRSGREPKPPSRSRAAAGPRSRTGSSTPRRSWRGSRRSGAGTRCRGTAPASPRRPRASRLAGPPSGGRRGSDRTPRGRSARPRRGCRG